MARDRENEFDMVRQITANTKDIDELKTDVGEIKGRIKRWDDLLLKSLLKILGTSAVIIGLGLAMGGSMKEAIIMGLKKIWHE